MKIGLISDTHIPDYHNEPPEQIKDAFADVELILHAGDIYESSCLDWLETIAPVVPCEGNGDYLRSIEDNRIKRSQVLELEGFKIGLTHAIPIPEIEPYATLEKTMEREFNGPVDIIVYGDTHVEEILRLKGVLLINPGSPTLPHNLTHLLGTVGILEIKDGTVAARILRIDPLEELDMENKKQWWSVR